MAKPIVFYSRCKPQGVDAIEIAEKTKRIFIGHPLHKSHEYDPKNLKNCVVDLRCDDDTWNAALSGVRSNQYNQNRNLVRSVDKGSIAMIPRPQQGVIYCGRIVSEFELVDAPAWYDDYLHIRRKNKPGDIDNENTWHAADVAQCWQVDRFREIPVPRIPVWIRRSLFGRSTYGEIRRDEKLDLDPYAVLSEIIESNTFRARSWTTDINEIQTRLLEDVTPSAFEHLMVSLLQLENPGEMWTHVGGSGDGGVDGIAADQHGKVTGLLQCKWQYAGESPFLAGIWKPIQSLKYLASLRHPTCESADDYTFMGLEKIAELVKKHSSRLPQALSMRIGAGTAPYTTPA